jgi:hypothetical protein
MPSRHYRRSQLIQDLRLAIDCLPVKTREAMLQGVSANQRIIVGAYVDEAGGVCPMLAAHRCGGRTDFLSFAKSWDRFTRAGRLSRLATDRELEVLIGQLEASLMDEARVDLRKAIAEHRRLVAEHRPRRTRLPDFADPSGPIIARPLRRVLWGRGGRPQRTSSHEERGHDRALSSR